MLFKEVVEQTIEIPEKSKIDIDAEQGVLLVPTDKNQRIFLHWISDKEKLIASHRLVAPTIVTKKLQIINPESQPVSILKLVLPSQNH